MTGISRTGNVLEDVAIKAAARVATTGADIDLSGLQTIDGIALNEGDRVLVKDQTDATENGIWQVSSGYWLRPADGRQNTDWIYGSLILVASGNTQAGHLFMQTCADNPVAVGVSDIAFSDLTMVQNAQQVATSATSVPIGSGAKTFQTQTGKSFKANQWLLFYSMSAPGNAMLAKIGAYTGAELDVTVAAVSGAGTFTDWQIVLANSPAAAGLMPPVGTGNVTGPGGAVAGHMPQFADNTGLTLSDSGIAPGPIASRSKILYGDVDTAAIASHNLAVDITPMAPVYPQTGDNLHLQNDTTNPTRDIAVTAGRVRDDADANNLRVISTLIKRLDQAWVPGGVTGSPTGACDTTGVKGASQTWHIYLIGKRGMSVTSFSRTSNIATLIVAGNGLAAGSHVNIKGTGAGFDGSRILSAADTNSVSFASVGADISSTSAAGFADGFDVLASQNYPTPVLPSGWTQKQCLGSVLTDGSGNIRQFFQFGDEFIYKTPVLDINNTTQSGVAVNYTLSVPLGLCVKAFVKAFIATVAGNSSANTAIYNPTTTAPAPITGGNSEASMGFVAQAPGVVRISHTLSVWTNTLAQVSAISSETDSGGFQIKTIGWRDPRRRLF